MYEHTFDPPTLESDEYKASICLPSDGSYITLLQINNLELPPRILKIVNGCIQDPLWKRFTRISFPSLYFSSITLTTTSLVTSHEWQSASIKLISVPAETYKLHGVISSLQTKIEELEEKVGILQELVDRPDGAGCKISYEQIRNVLS